MSLFEPEKFAGLLTTGVRNDGVHGCVSLLFPSKLYYLYRERSLTTETEFLHCEGIPLTKESFRALQNAHDERLFILMYIWRHYDLIARA